MADPEAQHVMLRRVAAAQAAVDAYSGMAMRWGKRECCRLAALVLKGLGHDARMSRFGFYSTAQGAQRAIMRQGFKDLAEVMDDLGFARIAQAAALPGDILGMMSGEPIMPIGLAVALGNGRVLAFLEDRVCHVVSPNLAVPDAQYFAWRCDPCPS